VTPFSVLHAQVFPGCYSRTIHNFGLWIVLPLDSTFGRLCRFFFDGRLLPRVPIVLAIVIVTLVWIICVVAASIADGSLRLPAPGRGLLSHYGFQVSVLAAPLVLLTTYYAVSYFLRILRDIDDLLVGGTDILSVRTMVKPHIESIFLRRIWSSLLLLFVFIGVAASVVIFRNLDSPATYWGNDVFNAKYYRYGYAVGNSFFICLWGFVYPLGIFYALHLTLSMEMIVTRLKRKGVLRLNFLHIDRCGGMSKFGTLNFLIMLIYLWPFAAILAFHFTHQYTYSSLVIAAAGMSVLFIAQSFYGIYAVSRTINAERKALVSSLNEQIAKAMEGTRKNFAAVGATLQYRDRVLSVSSFPYSHNISAAVNALRVAPGVITVVRYLAG
jgi:hypothetical protein